MNRYDICKTIVMLLILAPAPAWAQKSELVKQTVRQGLETAGRNNAVNSFKIAFWKKTPPFAPRQIVGPLPERFSYQAPLEKELMQYLRKPSAPLQKSVLLVWSENTVGNVGSGFIFEENLSGVRKLWVATAHHLAGSKGNTFSFILPGTKRVVSVSVAVSGRGGMQGVDMSLAELPAKYYGQVTPLRWAERPARKGEILHSGGYSSQPNGKRTKPVLIDGREVMDVKDVKFKTTYNFLPNLSNGACGGPVVNQLGLVLGMHCGSSHNTHSFAVGYEGVFLLLQEFYLGRSLRPVSLNGKPVAWVDVRDRLRTVSIQRKGEWAQARDLDRRAADWDFSYDRLENVYDFRPGDKVTLRADDYAGRAKIWDFVVE